MIREEILGELLSANDTVVLSGEAAQPYLRRIREKLEAEAQSLVNSRPPFEWLWYLRRLGGQFNWNELPTTDHYCQAIAEALCATSTSHEVPLSDDGPLEIVFPIDGLAVRDLTRLREIVAELYENHGTTRWAGKNSDISFTRGSSPHAEPTDDLDRAVRSYDRRIGNTGNLLAVAGLAADVQSEAGRSGRPSVFPLAGQMPGTATSPEWNGTVNGPMPYGFSRLDLSAMDVLTNQQLSVDLRWPGPLAALLVLSLIVIQPEFNSVAGVGDVYSRFGYCYVARNALVAWLNWAIDLLRAADPEFIPREALPEDAEAAIRDLEAVEITTYPPTRGRILHYLGRIVVVDLEAAAHAVVRCLERPVHDGEDVNQWSDTYELHVQAIINDSPWAPSDELAELRGRKLRQGGVELTDCDAIGELDGKLLLVSCKGRPYTQAYDRGDFEAIRNARTTAEDAVSKWIEVLEMIEANPIGNNFHFSKYDEVIGVVVMPFAPFVHEGPCTDEVAPGLRWVSSSNELRVWSRLP